MLEQYTRISVALSRDEFIALSQSAQRELRTAKDQARYLLRNALLSATTSQNNSKSVQPLAETDAFAQ